MSKGKTNKGKKTVKTKKKNTAKPKACAKRTSKAKPSPKAKAAKPSKKAKSKPSSKAKPAAEKTAAGNNSRTPNGRTLKTKDEYLPKRDSKVEKLKRRRWVVVVESNKRNELAVVRLTCENQKNTTLLPDYKKGNQKDTYFKHFVETKDNRGNPIKATRTGKFQENSPDYDLSKNEVSRIRSKTLKHSKQASENKRKIDDLLKDE